MYGESFNEPTNAKDEKTRQAKVRRCDVAAIVLALVDYVLAGTLHYDPMWCLLLELSLDVFLLNNKLRVSSFHVAVSRGLPCVAVLSERCVTY